VALFVLPAGEANAMKKYAENTMRELLSIYGLNSNEMPESITKSVDLANFSAGKCFSKDFSSKS